MTVAAAALLVSAGVASADAPALSITSPTSATPITHPSTIDVTGTLTHVGGSGANVNLCAVVQFTVTVTGDGYPDQVIGDDGNLTNPNDPCTETVYPWSFEWATPGVGEFTITATAKHGGATGTDSETVMVTSVTVEHPAAPAVANDLLKGTNVKGKQHGKCISAVADHMGSSDEDEAGTNFSGEAKSEPVPYRAAVQRFLVDNAGAGKACAGYPVS